LNLGLLKPTFEQSDIPEVSVTAEPSAAQVGSPRPSAALLARARAGDLSARDRAVREMLPAAARVARKFASSHHMVDDLTQVAGIGLLKAIQRFDPEREAAFGTYAHVLMTGEVRRHIRDSRMVRIPRTIYERVPRFQETLESLRRELGRNPSRQEIAIAMDLSKEDVIEIADAALHAQHVSLDAVFEDGAAETDVGGEDLGFERVEAGVDLAPMLRTLSPRERTIINLRFDEGLSQGEIATRMGLSPTQVSRLIHRTLAKLATRAGIGS
jgi:RNA polymerase sigma-B factor